MASPGKWSLWSDGFSRLTKALWKGERIPVSNENDLYILRFKGWERIQTVLVFEFENDQNKTQGDDRKHHRN
jgi:hypothetical protein